MTLILWWNDDLLLCVFDRRCLMIKCWIRLDVVDYLIVHKSGELLGQ